ncbi:3e554b14-2beb-4e4a-a534-26db0e0032c6 [Sclerotinia trifoliorum]|uniref:3e554b14-2beb-4e4a-a534-26db0e0032c6 n=1 Tax=Sclerotinia trifoliorum TaxID=28548 RepID=A0A8H2ZTI0_9HELO|nr:3e554b14-2beb-4e4a-a534-26db0e0032c6 [Sclerotinia trifoliorum]
MDRKNPPDTKNGNLRTNRNKRARTDEPAQAELDGAMAVIEHNLQAKSKMESEIENFKVRIEQLSSESSAATSRYQRLSDENANLQRINQKQASRIERQQAELSRIRKERSEESETLSAALASLNDNVIVVEEKVMQLASILKTACERRIKELRAQIAEGQKREAKLRDFEQFWANLKKVMAEA